MSGKVPVYDIQSCGPRRRFVANGRLVHNSDKLNVQNLPSRGKNAKQLKKAILAPPGEVLVDCDSSQIEARVLAWLAQQDDLVQAFANKEDVYIKMASRIYGVPESEVDKDQRFVGKTTILGAGFGMGANKFQGQLQTFGYNMPLDECQRIIDVYRSTNFRIRQLWADAGTMLRYLVSGQAMQFGRQGVLRVSAAPPGVYMPSGLLIRYDGLEVAPGEKGPQYTYATRRGQQKIYGGLVVENVTQSLARCVVAEQMLAISKRYKVALTVHDSVVCSVPEQEADEAQQFIEVCMRQVPTWAEGLPIDCESAVGKSYGDC